MQRNTATLLARIFFNISHSKKSYRRDALIGQVEETGIPSQDKVLLLDFINYYVDLRTKLTTDLRQRPAWKILAACTYYLDEQGAKLLAPEVEISIGVLGFDLTITDRGIDILNSELERRLGKSEATTRLQISANTMSAQARAASGANGYPYTIICKSRIVPHSPPEQHDPDWYKRLSQTEEHENIHHLFNWFLPRRARPDCPYAAIVGMRDFLLQRSDLSAVGRLEHERLLLSCVQAESPEIRSIDELAEADWQRFREYGLSETIEQLFFATASEFFAHAYTGDLEKFYNIIETYYWGKWSANLLGFDKSIWLATLDSAEAATNALCWKLDASPGDIPPGRIWEVCVIMLIDRDIRGWSKVAEEAC